MGSRACETDAIPARSPAGRLWPVTWPFQDLISSYTKWGYYCLSKGGNKD